MKSLIAFDTLAFVRELKESGMNTDEAEGLAKALMGALGQLMETKEIATRQDVLELRQELHTSKLELEQKTSYVHTKLKEQISDVRAELKDDISIVKGELKQDISTLKVELKQDIHDVKQEIRQTELKLSQGLFKLKDDLKDQELHLKSFIVRCFTTAIILLGGVQTIIHLCSK